MVTSETGVVRAELDGSLPACTNGRNRRSLAVTALIGYRPDLPHSTPSTGRLKGRGEKPIQPDRASMHFLRHSAAKNA
jgi:hypothetical protein